MHTVYYYSIPWLPGVKALDGLKVMALAMPGQSPLTSIEPSVFCRSSRASLSLEKIWGIFCIAGGHAEV
ncbi:MAG: hypothetical protein ABSE48_03610 [Verrucomicrobiota bacterium]